MSSTSPSPDDPTGRQAADEAILNDPRLARQSAFAGAFGVLLAPLVIGFIPAAIGLHAGLTHLRVRRGARSLAGIGLALSAVGGVTSALASVVWGALLLSILLQRSAIDQAKQWAGVQPAPWTLTDNSGVTYESGALAGRVIFLDICSPASPYSAPATEVLAAFAAKHPEVTALSWCPDCTAEEAASYHASLATKGAIAWGLQSMPEPFSLMSAKPTLAVIGPEGRIRYVHPGLYTAEHLEELLVTPTPEEPTLMGPSRRKRSPEG
jgi:hypothetical protein